MRNRPAALLTLLLVLAVAWWLLWPKAPVSTGAAAGAAMQPTIRAARAGKPPASIPLPPEVERQALAEFFRQAAVVSVVLDTTYQAPSAHHTSLVSPESLHALVPLELPEDLAGLEAVDTLLEQGFSTTAPVNAETLGALTAAGFGPEGETWKSDPWAAILDLEVIRQTHEQASVEHVVKSMRAAWTPEAREALDRGEAPSEADMRVMAAEVMKAQDYKPSLSVVESRVGDILERWPDHPAAHHARVYGIIAARSAELYDPPRGKQLIDELLAEASPELVALALEIAAGMLIAPNGVPLTDEDYARLGAWADAHPEHPLPHDLVDHCSLKAMDRDDAEDWLRRRAASVSKACADRGIFCDQMLEEGARRRAHLDARNGLPPGTWQAALTTVVRSCDDQHPLMELAVGVAVWENGWTWEMTMPPGPFLTCLTQATMPEPHPEPGQMLLLEAAPPGVPFPSAAMRLQATDESVKSWSAPAP
jgi:hypothetical protein